MVMLLFLAQKYKKSKKYYKVYKYINENKNVKEIAYKLLTL